MAECVVDRLELVEVDQQERAALAALDALLQLGTERIGEVGAVGEAGQAVEARHAVDALGAPALPGDVGADTAEACELARHVEARGRGEPPPACLAVADDGKLEIAEALAGVDLAEQGRDLGRDRAALLPAIAGEQLEERHAFQRLGRQSSGLSVAGRNVAQLLAEVDLPEPVGAMVLEIAQQQAHDLVLLGQRAFGEVAAQEGLAAHDPARGEAEGVERRQQDRDGRTVQRHHDREAERGRDDEREHRHRQREQRHRRPGEHARDDQRDRDLLLGAAMEREDGGGNRP